jgi:hypothetical protein
VTRPKLILGMLAAACVGTLLWYAWLIVSAELPRGARVASWALWLVASVAALTLFAYLREFLRHREAAGREASWKPLPGLVLLWLGGLTAMASIAFVLPHKAAAPGADGSEDASTSFTSQPVGAEAGASTPAVRTTTPVSRRSSRTSPPSPVSTSPNATPTGTRTTSSSSSPSTTSSSATRHGKPSTPPGKPTPSTTRTPLITLTLP